MYVFSFIDKIENAEPGCGLTAFFTLKGNEEFLQDHFGEFPVMPGVLMLESLKQAAGWSEALAADFREPYYRLVAADNVKYGQFVKPGNHLKIQARLARRDARLAVYEGRLERVDQPRVGATDLGRVLTATVTIEPVALSETERDKLSEPARRRCEALTAGAARP